MRANTSTATQRSAGVAQSMSAAAWAKLTLAVLATAALVTFLLQNRQDAEVNFLWFDWSTQMIWALLVSAIVGVVASALLTTLASRRRGAPER